MRIMRFYILPLVLIVSSVVLFITPQKKTVPLQEVRVCQKEDSLNANEMMTARFVIEALAEKYSLPVSVQVAGDSSIKIEAKDNTVIEKYNGIIGFLSSLRGLPYSLKYKELCIGKGCSKQLDMVLEVKK